MESTIEHDSEQKETDSSTDVNGENKGEEIEKELGCSFPLDKNVKDSDKEEELGDEKDERDKHVIIQPTRRIRTSSHCRKTNAFRARVNNRGIPSKRRLRL